jgi:hypothetical protein
MSAGPHGPEADSCSAAIKQLFDHLGYGGECGRNRQPDCLSGFRVGGQFELRRLLLGE